MKTIKRTMLAIAALLVSLAMIGCINPWQTFEELTEGWDLNTTEGITLWGGKGFEHDPGDVSPSLFDLDGNGTVDVVIGDAKGDIYFLRNNSMTGLDITEVHKLTTNFEANSAPVVYDTNGDGGWELIVGNWSGKVYLVTFTSRTMGDMKYEVTQIMADGEPLVVPSGYATPMVYDYNKDGWPDLIVGAADGDFYYYENTGAPGMTSFTFQGKSERELGERVAAATASLNGDGTVDFVVGNSLGEVYFCQGVFGKCHLKGQFDGMANPSAADINHDGVVDLVIGTGLGDLSYIPGTP